MLSPYWSIAPGYESNLQLAIKAIVGGESDVSAQAGQVAMVGATAVISFRGVVNKTFEAQPFVVSTRGVERSIARALEDESISTILLHIDSPGGSVDGLSDLGDAVMRARQVKRVVAQVDGMAASAAYYVASQADEIVAGRTDLIGSIGTRMSLIDASRAFDDAGLEVVQFDTGEFKSAGEFGTEITEAQRADFQRVVDDYFADFLKAIDRGRSGLNMAQVKTLATGQVWLAPEAKRLGLIDRVGTVQETLSRLSPRPRRRTARSYKLLARARGQAG